jgi:hypothetical protein
MRSGHQLALARDGGLNLLRTHLGQYLPKPSRLTEQEHREQIDNIVGWVGGLMKQWSGFVDERTGAPLPWWQARQQHMTQGKESARAAYEQAPDAYKKRHPYPGSAFPSVVGFGGIPSDPETIIEVQSKGIPAEHEYLREPGDDTEEE